MAELASIAASVDAALAALDLPDEPAGLYDPVRYVLGGGGKRVRPALTLLAAEAYGGEGTRARALPAALGVEVFHNFTLVHDDIMDRSATRRGRPTVHERWDEPTAILTGDLMMGLAADLVARSAPEHAAQLMRGHYRMTARLCEGQTLDMAFERRGAVSVDAYLDMIDRKTGALLEWALEAGAVVGGADDGAVRRLREAGRSLGRAFQIQDDLLDLTGGEGWGKPVGGDLVAGKRTYLVLRAIEAADDDAEAADGGTEAGGGNGNGVPPWLAEVLDGGLALGRVAEVRDRMDRLGVLDDAARAVSGYTEAARGALDALPDAPASDALRVLADALASRTI